MVEITSEKIKIRDAIGIILLNDKNEFLIGWSPRDLSYKIPQGGIDKNENIIDCVKRELLEELGIKIQNKDILTKLKGEYIYKYGEKTNKRAEELGVSLNYTHQKLTSFIVRYNNQQIKPNKCLETNFYEFDKKKFFWKKLDDKLKGLDLSNRRDCYLEILKKAKQELKL